ncbi:interferon gamma receptor 1 [Halichoeres trimaculatus]|uniref:interferon gamma receptor 1 n=1 Tax=Halichoeres trimaculatus TaxID=147232 RepID=UPI003D9EA51D
MLLDGQFWVLLIPLLLVVDGSSEIVPPPTNLTLSCDNFHVTASWKYKHPNTRFRVQIRDDPRTYETTKHYFDLSPSIWTSREQCLAVHYVSITAILGENQSIPVQSESLTYNKLKPAKIKCKLNFPPVDLEVVDGKMGIVTFQNPLISNEYLQQAVKSEPMVLEFRVITADGKAVNGQCKAEEECQKEFTLPEGYSQCVNLSGRLCDQPDFRCVMFNETGSICPDKDFPWILLGVLMSVIFVIIIVLTILICWTKSWTLRWERPSPPKPLVQPLTNHKKSYFTPDNAPQNDYSAVTLSDKKSCKSSLVSSEEEDLLDRRDRRNNRDESGAKDHDSNYKDAHSLEMGYSSSDDNSANDSQKTESSEIGMEFERGEEQHSEDNGDSEDNEVDVSPYDCPHSHTVTYPIEGTPQI